MHATPRFHCSSLRVGASGCGYHPSPVSDEVKIEGDGHTFRVMQWRNVLLTHWFKPVTVEALEITERSSFDLASRCPKGVFVLTTVELGLEMPSAPARKKSSEVLSRTGGHMLASATVVNASGLWAGAARAAVAAIMRFSKVRVPNKVFGSVEAAGRWGLGYIDPRPDSVRELVARAEDIARR